MAFANTNLKLQCDLGRICEIEDAVNEWYLAKYFFKKFSPVQVEFLKSCFSIIKIESAGVDGLISKIYAEANKVGTIDKENVGINIIVKAKGVSVTNEIRRVGLMQDRDADVEVRIGDQVVIYITRTTA